MSGTNPIKKKNAYYFKFYLEEVSDETCLVEFSSDSYKPPMVGDLIKLYLTETNYSEYSYYRVVEKCDMIHITNPSIVCAIILEHYTEKKKKSKKI